MGRYKNEMERRSAVIRAVCINCPEIQTCKDDFCPEWIEEYDKHIEDEDLV